MSTSHSGNPVPTTPASRSSGHLTRREWLAGAGAGTAALLLERDRLGGRGAVGCETRPRGRRRNRPSTVVFTNTTVANPDTVQDDVALAVEGNLIAAIGPERRGARAVPRRRGLRRAQQGALPGSHQLSRAHAGGRRARLQRGLRVPEHRQPGRFARQPPRRGGGQPHGAGRRARGHHHRDDHHRRVHGQRAAPGRSAGRLGAPLRTRRRDPRHGERARSGVHPFDGPVVQRDASLLRGAPRRWHAAHQRPLQHLARSRGRPHLGLPGGFAHRDLVARAPARGARLRRDARPGLHDPSEPEPGRVRVHGHAPRPSPGGVSGPPRLPGSAPLRGARALRQPPRSRASGPVGHHHLAPGGDGGEPGYQPADSGAAHGRLSQSRSAPTTTPTTSSR